MSRRRSRVPLRPGERRPSLEEVLGRLPREEASAGFTGRVLAAAHQRRSRRRPALGGALVPLALTGALAAAGLAGLLLAPRLGIGAPGPILEPPEEARPAGALTAATGAEAEALRRRVVELERQLADLRRLAAERQPLVAIEGDHADYLIDLRDFLPTTGDGRPVAASFRHDGADR